jgi:hypothetical protein
VLAKRPKKKMALRAGPIKPNNRRENDYFMKPDYYN